MVFEDRELNSSEKLFLIDEQADFVWNTSASTLNHNSYSFVALCNHNGLF